MFLLALQTVIRLHHGAFRSRSCCLARVCREGLGHKVYVGACFHIDGCFCYDAALPV